MKRPGLSNLDAAWHRHLDAITLYHYTNWTGITGIVSSRSLWATDVRHLNDESEFEYGRRLAIQKLDEIRSRVPGPSFVSELTAAIARLTTLKTQIFAASLAVGGDLLGLWRGYCTARNGYAIAFDRNRLQQLAQRRRWRLAPVIYSEAAQWECLNEVEAIAVTRRGSRPNPRRFADQYVRSFLSLAPFLKSPDFFEEGEWRLVPQYSPRRIQHRGGKRSQVPYIGLDLRARPGSSPFDHVIVGPHPRRRFGAPDLSSYCTRSHLPLSVRESGVPLRPR